jgi:recombinational DNA repair ATPase RecF
MTDFRRFAGTHKVELDSSLVAIVGPNEAGKSSLLEVLRRFDDVAPVVATDRSRRANVEPDSIVAEAQYLVEPADRDSWLTCPVATPCVGSTSSSGATARSPPE